MICKSCNQDKTKYNFFHFRGKYDKSFFVRPIYEIDGLCFDCAAPYRCLGCGQVLGAEHFRVQGRLCHVCKTAPLSIATGLNFNFETEKVSEYVEALENAESGGWEND